MATMRALAAAGPAWTAFCTISARCCGSLAAARNWLSSRLISACCSADVSPAGLDFAAAGEAAATAVIAASASAPAKVRSVMVLLFSAFAAWARPAAIPCRYPHSTWPIAAAAIWPSVGLLAVA